MRTFFVGALCAAVLVPAAHAVAPADPAALLRVAARLSGLQPKTKVKIVVESPKAFAGRRGRLLDRAYPRRAQQFDEQLYRALGLVGSGRAGLRTALLEMEDTQGVYDPRARTAFVRRGAGDRAASIHELVHALQDQHYDLRRLDALRLDRDASTAAAAAVEGHAGLATRAFGAGGAGVADGASPLHTFLSLERGFRYATGVRFAVTLQNLGGRAAVLGTLARLPRTSEQVFHVDAYLEDEPARAIVLPVDAGGYRLVQDDTFGELDVRALLAVFGVPRLDRVGTGWGGGRSALYRGGGDDVFAVALDWDTERDAAEWAEAVQLWVNEAFDADEPGLPAPVQDGATLTWTLGGRTIAFRRDGVRTVVALGGSTGAAAVAAAIVPVPS